MTFDALHADRCVTCGAPAGAPCRTASERLRTPHVSRRRALARPAVKNAPRAPALADVAAVKAGRSTVQEDALRGDRYDAWRVAVAAVFLSRSQGERARPVVREILARWPSPFALALASDSRPFRELAEPLGLFRRRQLAVRRLCVAELHGDPVDSLCGKYARESIALFVDRDLSFEPEDRVLSAARSRLLASAFA